MDTPQSPAHTPFAPSDTHLEPWSPRTPSPGWSAAKQAHRSRLLWGKGHSPAATSPEGVKVKGLKVRV
jgi:hypothetical protein